MKCFFLTLAVLACFGAYAVSFDISTGDLNITAGGSWEVTGTTTANKITVNTADPVTITLNGVSISGVSCALNIQDGMVSLVLVGNNNTLSGNQAICVPSGKTLSISGDGSLTATSTDDNCAGIGGNSSQATGTIVINSGDITARGGSFSAGIGGRYSGGNITINGGNIRAIGNRFAAGIGGGEGWGGSAGNITITGGSIYATAEHEAAAIGTGNCGGHDGAGGTITITGGTIEAHADKGAAVGGGNSDPSPAIYISGGSVYGVSNTGDAVGKGQNGTLTALKTAVNGQDVFLATVSAAIKDHTKSYTFTTEKDTLEYGYEYVGSGYSGDNNLYFYLPNGDYVVSDGEGKYFSGTIDNASAIFTQYVTGEITAYINKGPVTITEDGMSGYDENGDHFTDELKANYIITGTSTENGVTVSSGAPKITLNNCSISTTAAFSINGGVVTMVLINDNSLTSSGAAGLYVDSSATLTISDESTGSLTATSTGGQGAGIGQNGNTNGKYSGAIIINGGTITAQGNDFASGIGGGSHSGANVTINGGNVTATVSGYWGAAAIGSGYGNEVTAGTITINGGSVKATGGRGAGIGNGEESAGGTVIITGGTVEAISNSGAGIGASCASGDAGRGPNIYISGGSVKASSIGPGAGQGTCPTPLTREGGEAIHLATLPDAMVAPSISGYWIMGSAGEVTFTTQRNKAAYDYSYTGTGYSDNNNLYFYLPDGSYVIEGTNGKSMGGTISGADATFTVVPEPAFAALALLALAAFLRRK